ncbi:MAG: formylmethanofuran dehydrogenase subunit E family protein [Candidatus Bathyarchaeia archaeon]
MMLSDELLNKAVRLHGHLGPFLVLGLRMSLKAEELLGDKPEKCVLETLNRKPYLCAVDGIRAVFEGCPVEVQERDGLTATFVGSSGKEVTISVKNNLVERYMKAPWEKCEECAYEVMRSHDNHLFKQQR